MEQITKHKVVNILLVDDRIENLLSLEAVLNSPRYRLISVQSGEEALRWVLKEEFALILLDVQMPGMNGFETAKLIKQREKSRHIPILFVTAISQAMENVVQGYNTGAIDYIFKPFHPDILRMKVEGFVQLYYYQQQIKSQREMLQIAHERHYAMLLELQNSEALSRTLVETSADTILTIGRDRKILSSNSGITRMFGFEVAEVLDQPIDNLLSSEANLDLYEKSPGRVIETIAKRKDQQTFPAEIQIGAAVIGKQKVCVCFIRDISERKELEAERMRHFEQLEQLVEERTQELVLSQELFQKIFQSSPSMIAIRSCEDQRYMKVNDCWLHTLGYRASEMKDKTTHLLKLPHDEKRVADLEEGIRNEKIHFVTKHGEIREGLLSTETIYIYGEKCILSEITDITERIYLEKEMARLDRLHLIGEMAAGIAHEIRNPMTTVRGFLQLTKNRQDDAIMKYVDIMLAELDRANMIITEFLTLAKNRTTDTRYLSLNQTIESILPLVEAEASLAGKNIVYELGECPALLLDEKEIRQLFLNLTLNGLEAMQAGGTLTVKTYQEGDEVVLEIADQGNGISEDILDQIWTPFFTTKEGGTGLGLAVCYSIVNRHNGRIELDTSSVGSTFYIYFQQS